MHKMELGKANTFPDQPATPCAQRKMIALNTLRIPFARYKGTFRDVFLICVIAVRINFVNMKWSQQGEQFVQVFVFSRTKAIGQWNAGAVIHCPPQPILL